jgi:hypothetical protein
MNNRQISLRNVVGFHSTKFGSVSYLFCISGAAHAFAEAFASFAELFHEVHRQGLHICALKTNSRYGCLTYCLTTNCRNCLTTISVEKTAKYLKNLSTNFGFMQEQNAFSNNDVFKDSVVR